MANSAESRPRCVVLSVSLSRQIPFGLGWVVKPFVTSLPRESLEGTLQATRVAIKQLQQE